MAFLQRLELGDGVHVDCAEAIQLRAQVGGEVLHARPVHRRARRLHEPLVCVEERVRLRLEEAQVHLMSRGGLLAQVLVPQPQLGLAHLLTRAAVMPDIERLPLGAQFRVQRFEGGGGFGVLLAPDGDL